jgi:predicted CXXCH cytochrome family protein
LRSRAILAAAVLLAAACARSPRAAAPVAPPPAPAKALFVPYPAAEIQAVKGPHDYKGRPLCQRCHLPDGRLTADANALCAGCHKLAHGNHPVNVVQKTPVKDLPLLAGGKVACHTCHDPHRKKSALRKPFDDLCLSCHGRH